jgi:hypothetical protein
MTVQMEAAMSLHVRAARCLAAGLTSLALAAPAAQADSYRFPPGISEQEEQALASRGLSSPTPLNAELSAPDLPAADDAFDWGSAGVGAVTFGGLIVLAAGLGLTRRARVNSKPRPS